MTHSIFARVKKKLTKYFFPSFYDGLPDMGGYWLSDVKTRRKQKDCYFIKEAQEQEESPDENISKTSS